MPAIPAVALVLALLFAIVFPASGALDPVVVTTTTGIPTDEPTEEPTGEPTLNPVTPTETDTPEPPGPVPTDTIEPTETETLPGPVPTDTIEPTETETPEPPGPVPTDTPPGPIPTETPLPVPGYIDVSSSPSGAVAVLDGTERKNTPATFMAAGDTYHAVEVVMPGYASFADIAYVTGGETTTVSARLVPAPMETGSLDITSSPSGANIWIDGIFRGSTPQVVGGLFPGTATVTLRRSGYYDYTAKAPVSGNRVTRFDAGLTPYPPSPGVGSLQIDSDPAGAAIYLGNNFRGITPREGVIYINELKPGYYTLRLTLPGYESYIQAVLIRNGIIEDVHATLTPSAPGPLPDTTGQVTVESVPAGAYVYLGPDLRGITPLTLTDVAMGTHPVTLKMNGYLDWSTTVDVAPSGTYHITGTLPEGTQPTKSPVPAAVFLIAAGLIGMGAVLQRKRG